MLNFVKGALLIAGAAAATGAVLGLIKRSEEKKASERKLITGPEPVERPDITEAFAEDKKPVAPATELQETERPDITDAFAEDKKPEAPTPQGDPEAAAEVETPAPEEKPAEKPESEKPQDDSHEVA